MKPAPFSYYRADSVADATELLSGTAGAKVLAGGQSLIPAMNFRLATPTVLVDIGHIGELGELEVAGDAVTIGAAVTQSRVERSPQAAEIEPGLRAAIEWIGHLPIRNRGTVCGSLAHADPAAELPALAINSDAVLTVQGPQGGREVSATDFLRGPFWTDLQPAELITRIRFPAAPPRSVTRVGEIARRSGDFAVVGVVGRLQENGDVATGARFTGFAVGGTPVRLRTVEGVLEGVARLDPSTREALREAANTDVADPLEDIHATVEYRREALAALVIRVAQSILDGMKKEAS